jgi:NDP-sugar pyrophosphorylase family protein
MKADLPDYKVLVPTSGTGSRLKELTARTNKSLVLVNGKPALSSIIEAYPMNVSFVITLGYLGKSVKAFLDKQYPKRIFEYVTVDKFEGPGSSLGYSMLLAKEHLQCPFIFHACDTLVSEPIPAPDHNWVGGYQETVSAEKGMFSEYRSHRLEKGIITEFIERGLLGFDSIHIGLDGIHDYQAWWRILEDMYQAHPEDASLSDVPVLDKMLRDGIPLGSVTFKTWCDTGNLPALSRTQSKWGNPCLS